MERFPTHAGQKKALEGIEVAVHDQLATLRKEFKEAVERLAGAVFASVEEKVETVKRVKRLAKVFGVELLFEGTRVNLQLAGNCGVGSIQVKQKNRLLHAKSTFPPLQVREPSEEIQENSCVSRSR